MAKKGLKGFCGARVWPLTANTDAAYTPGEMVRLPHAQNLTKEVTGEEYTLYADDTVYDAGIEFQYEELTFTVRELDLAVQAQLTGAEFDEQKKTYRFKDTDTAPEYAFGYAALQRDGNYHMFVHYAVKLMSVKVDHETRGQSSEGNSYELTFRGVARAIDGAIRDENVSDDKSMTWLDTIEKLPAGTPVE